MSAKDAIRAREEAKRPKQAPVAEPKPKRKPKAEPRVDDIAAAEFGVDVPGDSDG